MVEFEQSDNFNRVIPEYGRFVVTMDGFIAGANSLKNSLESSGTSELTDVQTTRFIKGLIGLTNAAEGIVESAIQNGLPEENFILWYRGKIREGIAIISSECERVEIEDKSGKKRKIRFKNLLLDTYVYERLRLKVSIKRFDNNTDVKKQYSLRTEAISATSVVDMLPLVRASTDAKTELDTNVSDRRKIGKEPLVLEVNLPELKNFELEVNERSTLVKLLKDNNREHDWLASDSTLKNYYIRSRYFYGEKIEDLDLNYPNILLDELVKLQKKSLADKSILSVISPISEKRLNQIIEALHHILDKDKDRTVALLKKPIDDIVVYNRSLTTGAVKLKVFLDNKDNQLDLLRREADPFLKQQKTTLLQELCTLFLTELQQYKEVITSNSDLTFVSQSPQATKDSVYRAELNTYLLEYEEKLRLFQKALNTTPAKEVDPTAVEIGIDSPDIQSFAAKSIKDLVTDLATNTYNDESYLAWKLVMDKKLEALGNRDLTEMIDRVFTLFSFGFFNNRTINTNYGSVNYAKLLEGFAAKADGVGIYDKLRRSDYFEMFINPIVEKMIELMREPVDTNSVPPKGEFNAAVGWDNGTALSDKALALMMSEPAYNALFSAFPQVLQKDMQTLFARIALYDASLRDMRTKIANEYQGFLRKAYKHSDGSPVQIDGLWSLIVYKVTKGKDLGWLSGVLGFIGIHHDYLHNHLNNSKPDLLKTNESIHEREHDLETYFDLLFNYRGAGHHIMSMRADFNSPFPFPFLDDFWSAPINEGKRDRLPNENAANFLKSNEYTHKLVENTAKAWDKDRSADWKKLNAHDFEREVTKCISDMLSTASNAISFYDAIQDPVRKADCFQIVRRAIDHYIVYLYAQLPFDYEKNVTSSLMKSDDQLEYEEKRAKLKAILTKIIKENSTFNKLSVETYKHGRLENTSYLSDLWLETVNDKGLEKKANFIGRKEKVRGFNEHHLSRGIEDKFKGFMGFFRKMRWASRNREKLDHEPHYPFKETSDLDTKKE